MRSTETLSNHLILSLETQLQNELSKVQIELTEEHPTTETLFALAQKQVEQIWQKVVVPACQELLVFYGQIHQEPNLLNPKSLHKLITQKHLLELQYLETENPELWSTLIKLSMLYQDLEVTAFQIAAKDSKRPMLVLAADMAATLGPLFNQAYLQQQDLYQNHRHLLAEQGGKKTGAQYVYELRQKQKGQQQKLPFKELLPAWGEIAAQFELFAKRVEQEFADGQKFTAYLRYLAKIYGSSETKTNKLRKMWQKAQKMQSNIDLNAWPINLIVTRDVYQNDGLNKVDANLTIDINTRHTKNKMKIYQPYFHTARKLVKKHHLRSKIAPPHISFLLYGSGQSVFWPNLGEAGETALCHSNHLHDEAALKEGLEETLELFEVDSDNLTLEEFKELELLSIYLHELSHTILPVENKKVSKRVGCYEMHVEMLDELKAEATSARIFYQTNNNSSHPPKLKKFLQYLIAAHDLDQKQSGDEDGYETCSRIIIYSLLQAGAISKNAGKYQILNPELAFQTLIKLSVDIMNHYDNKQSTPQSTLNYAEKLKITLADKAFES